MTTPEFYHQSPAEQAFADAKATFRTTMLKCEPFADLVMNRLGQDRLSDDLPNFECEPRLFSSDQGGGFGVRLAFSGVYTERGDVGVRVFKDIKIAELGGSTFDVTPLAAELVNDSNASEAEENATAIGTAYLVAFKDFQHTELPGDTLMVDGSGLFKLQSSLASQIPPME